MSSFSRTAHTARDTATEFPLPGKPPKVGIGTLRETSDQETTLNRHRGSRREDNEALTIESERLAP